MGGSLGAALEAQPVPAFEQAPLGTRRVCFLSGMYAAEVMETISAYREIGEAVAEVAAAQVAAAWVAAALSWHQWLPTFLPAAAPPAPCCRPARSCVCGSGAQQL